MYDMEAHGGGLIIQLVKTHSRFLVGGALFDNPYAALIADLLADHPEV